MTIAAAGRMMVNAVDEAMMMVTGANEGDTAMSTTGQHGRVAIVLTGTAIDLRRVAVRDPDQSRHRDAAIETGTTDAQIIIDEGTTVRQDLVHHQNDGKKMIQQIFADHILVQSALGLPTLALAHHIVPAGTTNKLIVVRDGDLRPRTLAAGTTGATALLQMKKAKTLLMKQLSGTGSWPLCSLTLIAWKKTARHD